MKKFYKAVEAVKEMLKTSVVEDEIGEFRSVDDVRVWVESTYRGIGSGPDSILKKRAFASVVCCGAFTEEFAGWAFLLPTTADCMKAEAAVKKGCRRKSSPLCICTYECFTETPKWTKLHLVH